MEEFTPEEMAMIDQIEAMEAEESARNQKSQAQIQGISQRATPDVRGMMNQQFPQQSRNPMAENVASRAMYGVEDMMNAPRQGVPGSLLPPQGPVVDPLRPAPSTQVGLGDQHLPSMGDYLSDAGGDLQSLAEYLVPPGGGSHKGQGVGALSNYRRGGETNADGTAQAPSAPAGPKPGDRKPHPENPSILMVRKTDGLWHPEGRGPQSMDAPRVANDFGGEDDPDFSEASKRGSSGGTNPDGPEGRELHPKNKRVTDDPTRVHEGDYYITYSQGRKREEYTVRRNGEWVIEKHRYKNGPWVKGE